MSLDLRTVADRYAKAVFELASEQDQLDAVHEELTGIKAVF